MVSDECSYLCGVDVLYDGESPGEKVYFVGRVGKNCTSFSLPGMWEKSFIKMIVNSSGYC